jgi:hypothetical protein
MSQEEGQLSLAGRRVDKANDPELVNKVALARASVSKRPSGVDQSSALTDPPTALDTYLAEFKNSATAKAYIAEGWGVQVADLRKVCALQPIIFSDHAEERAADVAEGDIVSAARVTLPLPEATELPIQFDPARNTWMISSRNPNLRLVGQFSSKVDQIPGGKACGFIVAVTPSFVQVAFHRGRYLLRDGYHRSLGLLRRGFSTVPVLYKEFSPYDDLGLGQGMLPGQAFLGDRPPLLADYLDEVVSCAVAFPATQKMVIVQGTEMTPLG